MKFLPLKDVVSEAIELENDDLEIFLPIKAAWFFMSLFFITPIYPNTRLLLNRRALKTNFISLYAALAHNYINTVCQR